MQLLYAEAVQLMEADEHKDPELWAEKVQRHAVYAEYFSTVLHRLQSHSATIGRPEELLEPLSALPPTPPRTPAQLRAQTEAPGRAGLPPPSTVDWQELVRQSTSFADLLTRAARLSVSIPDLPAFDAVDPCWSLSNTNINNTTYAIEYVYRIVLWTVSMFWGSMVWDGRCVTGQASAIRTY